MQLLQAAGLPPGVINLIYGDPTVVSDAMLSEPTLAGVHFTGSTDVFNRLLKSIGERSYRSYPRVVGETGGKNFILAHPSADSDALATAVIRGAFEYQGQKCSPASRLFIPQSLWPRLRERLCDDMAGMQVGDVCDLRNFMGAVIDEAAWRRLHSVIAAARENTDIELVIGGETDRSIGFFVKPTLLRTNDPGSRFMSQEFFGPIATAYVYADRDFEKIMNTIDVTSPYALTGAIFSTDRAAIADAVSSLRHAAGNLYINDKPTGAVVGEQPFGGGRASGTNDKAGSMWNLIRWASPRTIKETFAPPHRYTYPLMAD
jgi:1-pyrroline-5-carboxylate dehydrogenase